LKFSISRKALKMTIVMEKSAKILESCDADLENADVHDTGYYPCIATFLAFQEAAEVQNFASHSVHRHC